MSTKNIILIGIVLAVFFFATIGYAVYENYCSDGNCNFECNASICTVK